MHRPAVLICGVLGALTFALVGVSLWVPGPAPTGSDSPGGIVTAVTPTELGAAGAGR
ncbi:hypothetical protein [Saccharopolyspora sp. CA-218241]|uniref:hypothetical protein n=1 Tax=Saccharopolyspora sp. CA-218241 TaxID=3240027 RepID=UPI003D9528C4